MKKRLGTILAALYIGLFCLPAGASQVESELSHRRFTTQDGLPQIQTETIWQDSRGYIYIGTLSGFVRFDGRTMTPFLRGRRENIVAFQETDGEVRALGFVRQWMPKGGKVRMAPIDPEGKMLLNNFNSPDLPPGYILLENRQEQERVLCHWESGEWTRILESPLLDKMTPDRKLYLDSLGLFIPTPDGLYLKEGEKLRRISKKADIFSLLRRNDQLIALAADGLWLVEADSLHLLYKHDFEAPDYGLAVRKNQEGQLLIADAHTLWRYDSRENAPLQQLATGFNLIKSLFIDKWDRIWMATYQGAYCFFHGHIINHRLRDRNDLVRAIAFADGHRVEGTLNGRILMDGELLEERKGNFYNPGAAVMDGKVYMAGNGDVFSVTTKGVHALGLPPDNYRFVSQFGRQLMVATGNALLSFYPDRATLDTVTLDIARPWCAADDGNGQLWISGNPGLYSLALSGNQESRIRKWKNTSASQVITSLSADGKGHVCFALGDSLFCVFQDRIRHLKEVQPLLNGHEIRAVHLSPNSYLVAAAIDGILVARTDSTLHAQDAHWLDVRNGFTAIEPQMGPMAESEDGTLWLCGVEEVTSFRPQDILSDNRESTVIKEPLPWWKQWWTFSAATLLLSLLVGWTARKIEKQQGLKKMETLEREKKLKELQLATIRLRAIPHFHANVLSSIEYFVLNHSSDEASHYLKLYSNFTNQTLLDIDRPARSLAEELDYVRSYLELEKLRFGDRLQYHISVATDVNESVLLPTMLLHTYCENAVKHGIASKTGTGTVDIRVTRQLRQGVDGILVSVQDDGVGRREAARSGGPSTKQGLRILQQQIELYNQANETPIQLQVEDLADADGHPGGTRFETWIPSKFNY